MGKDWEEEWKIGLGGKGPEGGFMSGRGKQS